MCRSRRELSNAHLLAKIGLDTAENEPSKVCRYQHSRPRSGAPRCDGRPGLGPRPSEVLRGRAQPDALERPAGRQQPLLPFYFRSFLHLLLLIFRQTRFCSRPGSPGNPFEADGVRAGVEAYQPRGISDGTVPKKSGRWLGRAQRLAKKGASGRMQRLTELVPIPSDPYTVRESSVKAP